MGCIHDMNWEQNLEANQDMFHGNWGRDKQITTVLLSELINHPLSETRGYQSSWYFMTNLVGNAARSKSGFTNSGLTLPSPATRKPRIEPCSSLGAMPQLGRESKQLPEHRFFLQNICVMDGGLDPRNRNFDID